MNTGLLANDLEFDADPAFVGCAISNLPLIIEGCIIVPYWRP